MNYFYYHKKTEDSENLKSRINLIFYIIMKKIKKLTLKKETIVSLEDNEMKELKGGSVAFACTIPCNYTKQTCSGCPSGYPTWGPGSGGGGTPTYNTCRNCDTINIGHCVSSPCIGYSVGYIC